MCMGVRFGLVPRQSAPSRRYCCFPTDIGRSRAAAGRGVDDDPDIIIRIDRITVVSLRSGMRLCRVESCVTPEPASGGTANVSLVWEP